MAIYILLNVFVYLHLRMQSARKNFAFVLLRYGRNSVTAALLLHFAVCISACKYVKFDLRYEWWKKQDKQQYRCKKDDVV